MSYVSRIVKLKGFDRVLLGRDIGNVFEEGHVYAFLKINGEIICKDLGEHAIAHPNGEKRTIGQIATEGVYCLTKNEYAEQLKATDG